MIQKRNWRSRTAIREKHPTFKNLKLVQKLPICLSNATCCCGCKNSNLSCTSKTVGGCEPSNSGTHTHFQACTCLLSLVHTGKVRPLAPFLDILLVFPVRMMYMQYHCQLYMKQTWTGLIMKLYSHCDKKDIFQTRYPYVLYLAKPFGWKTHTNIKI